MVRLLAGVHGGAQVLTSRLYPLHRPTQLASEQRQSDFLRVHVLLDAESTTNIRCDDANGLLRKVQQD